MSATTSPQPSVRRDARERQQAVLRDCAQRFPGLAPLFTVKPKTNYSVSRYRAGLADLPPRFATLQHHLQFPQPQPQPQNSSSSSSSSSSANIASNNPLQAQQTTHHAPQHAASVTAYPTNNQNSNNGTTAPTTAPPVVNPQAHTPPSQIILTIQPHAALTPQEIAMHTRLRQIGLFPRGSPEEIAARKARIEEHKRTTERKKQVREARKAKKKKQQQVEKEAETNEAKHEAFLKAVKRGRIEKQKFEKTPVGRFLFKDRAASQEEDEEDDGEEDEEDKELWGY